MGGESAVFPTNSLLELSGDECDNLNFMNFKIDSLKIREKFVNFRNFLNSHNSNSQSMVTTPSVGSQ